MTLNDKESRIVDDLVLIKTCSADCITYIEYKKLSFEAKE